MDRLAVKRAGSGLNALKCAIELSIPECWGFSQVSGWAEGKWLQYPWLSTSLALPSTCEHPAGLPLYPFPPLPQGSQEAWSPPFPQTSALAWPHSRGQAGHRWQNPEGGGRRQAGRNNILNSLSCKRTLLGTLLWISLSFLSKKKNNCLTYREKKKPLWHKAFVI